MRLFALLFSLLFPLQFIYAQRNIDVLNYQFHLSVNDNNDVLKGKAEINFIVLHNSTSAEIDLKLSNGSGKGMTVESVNNFSFTTDKERNKVIIQFGKELKAGDTSKVSINYQGIPEDGLIISKNKFGKRTFFADNWPNRAHNWIPCVDDPADKASVEFIVTAPSQYQVISNGILKERTNLPGNLTLTHWDEDQPLPTKVMVVGIAEFAIQYNTTSTGLPVSTWVFPENREQGFYDYYQAIGILEFFNDYIGPYPFQKLANVQSKSIFGGMENAGAIFYAENTVTGTRSEDRLIGHEIVHQWFGDHVTEASFAHLWLSEGFATYLAQLYMEHKYGKKKLQEQMITDRKQVIAFARNSSTPVVDSVSALMELLNANSYQKGGWVLHMLREQVGDIKFKSIVRKFYQNFAGKNASTNDFQKIAELITGDNLAQFFKQWLYEPELPSISVKWDQNLSTKQLTITVHQKQSTIFHFPLQILVEAVDGESVTYDLEMNSQSQSFQFEMAKKVKNLVIDPNVRLLATW